MLEKIIKEQITLSWLPCFFLKIIISKIHSNSFIKCNDLYLVSNLIYPQPVSYLMRKCAFLYFNLGLQA